MNCLKCLLPLGKASNCYGIHDECFTKWFEVPCTSTFTSLTRRTGASYEENTNLNLQNNSFFHGKFKKYSAILEGKSFILKMRQEAEAPELPEVEYLCNQIGDVLDVPVPEYYIINFEGDRVFVTKNFIHPTIPMDLQHIHNFRDNHQHNCKDLIAVVKEHTKRPHWVTILIKTILFDSLIGNHDRHGRNLAFLVMSNNISLAPIYDNVSYLSLESGSMLKADFNPTGKIATEHSQEPSMKDYVLELCRLGFESEVLAFYLYIKVTLGGIETIEELVEKSFCSSLMKQALKKLIRKRYMELQNELVS
jgi:hypothetical protein